jgi:hypothetical protein
LQQLRAAWQKATAAQQQQFLTEIRDAGPSSAEEMQTVPWRDAFPNWNEAQRPSRALAGARHKEGLTQQAVATATGIPQRHLSEMEHDKRPIGKERAKKLAAVLHMDYRIFL